MRKLLKRALTNEAGFTLMELIVVVLIVGILAAVGVPLYLGYVRDSRLAEAKALAGAALTASQACAQNDPAGTTCTLANLAQRIGVTAAGVSGDARWTVGIAPVTLNVATNQFGGGPLTVADLREAVMEGALLRLRPKLMTVSTVVAGLLPIFWSARVGSEVIRPLATPVLGGMLSSLAHVLIVTPILFLWLRERELRRGHQLTVQDDSPEMIS